MGVFGIDRPGDRVDGRIHWNGRSGKNKEIGEKIVHLSFDHINHLRFPQISGRYFRFLAWRKIQIIFYVTKFNKLIRNLTKFNEK